MKKNILFICLLLSAFLMFSCDEPKQSQKGVDSTIEVTDSTSSKSNHVQDIFFGAKFGNTQDEVINKFSKHGFVELIHDGDIEQTKICFMHKSDEYCLFDGIQFVYIVTFFVNNRFEGITFVDILDDETSAIEKYNSITEKLASKYNEFRKAFKRECKELQMQTNCDTVYSLAGVIGSNNCRTEVSCIKTTPNEICVTLSYSTKDLLNKF